MEDVLRKTPELFWNGRSNGWNTTLSKNIIRDSFVNGEFVSVKSSPLKIRSIRVIISDKNFFPHGGC